MPSILDGLTPRASLTRTSGHSPPALHRAGQTDPTFPDPIHIGTRVYFETVMLELRIFAPRVFAELFDAANATDKSADRWLTTAALQFPDARAGVTTFANLRDAADRFREKPGDVQLARKLVSAARRFARFMRTSAGAPAREMETR